MRRFIILNISLFCLFSFCIPLAAKDSVSLNREGVEAGRQGNFDQALQKFNESVNKADKGAAKVYHNKGWLYEQEGNISEALKFYEKALERNPYQLPTLERAGYLHYVNGNFIRAVELGERGLKIDPDNESILKWISDAHAKKIKQQKETEEKKKEDEEKEKLEDEAEKERKEEQDLFSIKYFIGSRVSYNLQKGDGFSYQSTDGLFGYNLPNMLYMSFTPKEKFEFYLETGTPYNGALLSDVQNWYERFEFIYRNGTICLGAGIMGSHYNNNTFYGETKKLDDYKLGFVIKKKAAKYSFEAILYPRMIPADAGFKPEKTLDTDYIDISFTMDYSKVLKLDFGFTIKEFYFFDHAVPVSHYAGTYDFKGGVAYMDNPKSKFTAKVFLIERLYMKDLNNDKPYDYFNGQGLFGFNRNKWYKGDPISGYDSHSHIIKGEFIEKAGDNFRFYQNAHLEIIDLSDLRFEFAFEVGIGYYY